MSPRPIFRFLLPRGQTRHYSVPKLAKPTKFTPPSHPSRRLADPINYPGPPRVQDPKKRYPNTMPPPDTWAHYFLTSRRLHFYLSLGILASLAGTVTISNFLCTSPYAHEIEWSWSDPAGSLQRLGTAWKKSVEEESRRTAEMRRRKVEDVEKRGEYRRRHGLEQTGDEGGFGGFGTKKPGEDRRVEAQVLVAKAALEKEAARGGNTAGWVEEELKKIEEDAEREAVKEAEDLGAAVEQVQEKKPGWKVW